MKESTLHPSYALQNIGILEKPRECINYPKLVADLKDRISLPFLLIACLSCLIVFQSLRVQQLSANLSSMQSYNEAKFAETAKILRFLYDKKESPAKKEEEKTSGFSEILGTTTVSRANLRTGPGAKYPVLLTLSDVTELIADIELNDWYKVRTPDGRFAWISGEIFKVRDERS